jgi:predicted PurR-regulated permease PerM
MSPAESRFYPRVFGLATAALLGFAVFRLLRPFVGAILWSVLLAFLLSPLNGRLRSALGERPGSAAILLTVAVVILLIGPVLGLGVAFVTQSADLFAKLQATADRLHIARPSDLLHIPVVNRVLEWAEANAPVSADQVRGWLVSAATTALQFVVASSGAFAVEAFGTLVNAVIAMFLLFFFLRDGDDIVRRALRLVPLDPARRAELVDQLAAVTRAVVFGSLVTALVQGALVGIAFALIDLPSPVVFGVLAAVASLVPFVGAALVWVPGALVMAVEGRWGAALFLVAWSVIVVGTSDNFVRPLFISGRARITTMPAFLGVAGGISAFGVIGLVLGPVIVALVLALLGFAERSRGLPPEIADRAAGVPASPAAP